jgi:dephospho-CoA kinase
MGKSTVADHLSRQGEHLIDTDVLARELVAPGQPALEEIAASFGAGVINRDETLNRAALGFVVFRDVEKRRKLESILHPRIRQAWRDWAAKVASDGVHRAVVVIPLLFETGAERELDLTICVACGSETQTRRLQARGWTEEEITGRLAAQMPIREKMERAGRVVWNDTSLEVCQLQVARIFAGIP